MKNYLMIGAMFVLGACATTDPTAPLQPLMSEDALGVIMYSSSDLTRDNKLGLSVGRFDEDRLDVDVTPARRGRVDFVGNFGYQARYYGAAHYLAFVEPGTYAVETVHHQSIWHLCQAENTVTFEVRPGEVTYLGTLNPVLSYVMLGVNALTEGDYYSSGRRYYYQGDFPAPRFDESEENEAAARAFFYRRYEGSTAEFTDAEFGEGRFPADGGWLGTGYQRRCAE